jgi:DNA-binding Xre family transcriptional regulator
MRIRLRLKDVAKQKGFSMGKLSRESDVSYNTIKRIYDNPYYSITTHTLAKFAEALNVSSSELLADEPD